MIYITDDCNSKIISHCKGEDLFTVVIREKDDLENAEPHLIFKIDLEKYKEYPIRIDSFIEEWDLLKKYILSK